jgi:hypothetical protein
MEHAAICFDHIGPLKHSAGPALLDGYDGKYDGKSGHYPGETYFSSSPSVCSFIVLRLDQVTAVGFSVRSVWWFAEARFLRSALYMLICFLLVLSATQMADPGWLTRT